MMELKHIFITVGTTKFKKLIDKLQEKSLVDVLKRLKCKLLTVQAGEYDIETFDTTPFESAGIDVNLFHYADSIRDYMVAADLIVGHAGAGTCLEGLRLNKRMVIVINEDLMDNHQTELAVKLSEENYAEHCTVDTLVESLDSVPGRQFKPFPKQDTTILANFIDNLFRDLLE